MRVPGAVHSRGHWQAALWPLQAGRGGLTPTGTFLKAPVGVPVLSLWGHSGASPRSWEAKGPAYFPVGGSEAQRP